MWLCLCHLCFSGWWGEGGQEKQCLVWDGELRRSNSDFLLQRILVTSHRNRTLNRSITELKKTLGLFVLLGWNSNFRMRFKMHICCVGPKDLKVKLKSISDGLSVWYKHVGMKCMESTYGRPIWYKQVGLRNIHTWRDWFVNWVCKWSWRPILKHDLR